MKPWMIFTVEPMINIWKHQCIVLKDNWTVKTKDKSLSAQWEHTILVTETGYEILTKTDKDFGFEY
jgi:methionyl aminopeptidase